MKHQGIDISIPQLFSESFIEAGADQNFEPFCTEDFLKTLSLCGSQETHNTLDLFKTLETNFKTKFTDKKNHLISGMKTKSSSELLAALLVSVVWSLKQKGPHSTLISKSLFYFLDSNGEILRLNSNTARLLNTSEKFDLLNDEATLQYDFLELIKMYYEEICEIYIKTENFSSLTKAQSYMIQLDPRDSKWFARRGLTFKRMGEFTKALSDLKRFLSFSGYEDAPEAVKNALVELEGLNALNTSPEGFQIH